MSEIVRKDGAWDPQLSKDAGDFEAGVSQYPFESELLHNGYENSQVNCDSCIWGKA